MTERFEVVQALQASRLRLRSEQLPNCRGDRADGCGSCQCDVGQRHIHRPKSTTKSRVGVGFIRHIRHDLAKNERGEFD